MVKRAPGGEIDAPIMQRERYVARRMRQVVSQKHRRLPRLRGLGVHLGDSRRDLRHLKALAAQVMHAAEQHEREA